MAKHMLLTIIALTIFAVVYGTKGADPGRAGPEDTPDIVIPDRPVSGLEMRHLRVRRQAEDDQAADGNTASGNAIMVQNVENRQHASFRNQGNSDYKVNSRRHNYNRGAYYGGDSGEWDDDDDDDSYEDGGRYYYAARPVHRRRYHRRYYRPRRSYGHYY